MSKNFEWEYQLRTNFSKTSNIVIHLRLQIFICMQSQRSLQVC